MQAGEVIEVDFGLPLGNEAGLVRPAVLVTSSVILRRDPRTCGSIFRCTHAGRDESSEIFPLPDGAVNAKVDFARSVC